MSLAWSGNGFRSLAVPLGHVRIAVRSLGWRDGNGSVTRSCVVVRWLVLLSLVPIAWGLAYGNFAILEHWMVGLHVPVYLVSRFVSWRRLRKQRLVEMEMEEAGAFAGRASCAGLLGQSAGQLVRWLASAS